MGNLRWGSMFGSHCAYVYMLAVLHTNITCRSAWPTLPESTSSGGGGCILTHYEDHWVEPGGGYRKHAHGRKDTSRLTTDGVRHMSSLFPGTDDQHNRDGSTTHVQSLFLWLTIQQNRGGVGIRTCKHIYNRLRVMQGTSARLLLAGRTAAKPQSCTIF